MMMTLMNSDTHDLRKYAGGGVVHINTLTIKSMMIVNLRFKV